LRAAVGRGAAASERKRIIPQRAVPLFSFPVWENRDKSVFLMMFGAFVVRRSDRTTG